MLEQQFVECSVAVARLRRQQQRVNAEFTRWLHRATLAQQLNRPELAQAARAQAVVVGETAAVVSGHLAGAEAWLHELKVQLHLPRS